MAYTHKEEGNVKVGQGDSKILALSQPVWLSLLGIIPWSFPLERLSNSLDFPLLVKRWLTKLQTTHNNVKVREDGRKRIFFFFVSFP